MGFKSQVERWFRAWIEEWADRHLGERIDDRIEAWGRVNLADLDARIDGRIDGRLLEWSAGPLKGVVESHFDARIDGFIDEKFDLRFFTWADTWADRKLKVRLDDHFDARFHEHLDDRLKARVANQIDDRIDRRIEQWVHAIRVRQGDQSRTSPPVDTPPTSGDKRPADTLVTAAELARYLQGMRLGPAQVRRLLKGQQAGGGRPYTYRLGDAASWILLQRGSVRRKDKSEQHVEPGRGREQSA